MAKVPPLPLLRRTTMVDFRVFASVCEPTKIDTLSDAMTTVLTINIDNQSLLILTTS